jgi:hypothetical protein
MDYMKGKLGPDWIKAESAKTSEQQHPLMQWALRLFEYQKETNKNPGQVTSAPMNGVVAAYLGTAYALYLLEHNVELQERLLKRLKDIGQFQGAYYELLVASVLIRAGFRLTLEMRPTAKTSTANLPPFPARPVNGTGLKQKCDLSRGCLVKPVLTVGPTTNRSLGSFLT